jgi:hypothetical protein
MQLNDNGSLTGLARRWLKSQVQLHGNPQRAYRDRQQADAIEQEMREQATEQVGRAVFNAVVPAGWKRKLTALEEQRIEQQDERRRARQLAMPRAMVTLSFRGAIQGKVAMELPVRVEWPGQDGAFTIVDVEPVEPVTIGSHSFHGMRFAVPAREAHAGHSVDLTRATQQHARYWDPLDTQIWFDESDDPFFWSDMYGTAHFWPEPGLQMVQFLMPVQNAAGERISIEGSLTFGEAIQH